MCTTPRSRGGRSNTLSLVVVLHLFGGRRRGRSNTLALVVVAVVNEKGVLSAKLGESGSRGVVVIPYTYREREERERVPV